MMAPIGLRLTAFFTFGAILGYAYLAALALNVRLYLASEAGWTSLAAHVVRVLAIIAAFTLCAHRGAPALISSVAGFYVMRIVTISRQALQFAKKS